MEKINFKAFEHKSDLQRFLESQLPIGVANPIDVFSFLGEQNLRHSRFVDNSEAASSRLLPFEHTIFSSAPAKRIGWLFEAHWNIRFHFESHKLAKVEVDKIGMGI